MRSIIYGREYHRDNKGANIHILLVRKPGRAHVKWIYLFSKWFGLLNQMSGLLHAATLLRIDTSFQWYSNLDRLPRSVFSRPSVNLQGLLYL